MGLSQDDIARLGPEAQSQVQEALKRRIRESLAGYFAREREKTQQGGSKYRNQPDSRGNLRFDSRREARRYDELRALLSAGKIRGLKLQPQFTLQESYITETGERVRAVRYIADFAYERATEPDCNGDVHWLLTVEDVKSPATKTPIYQLKKKLMQEKLGISVCEV